MRVPFDLSFAVGDSVKVVDVPSHHGQWSWTGCEMCGLEETAKAIRNNEHRKGDE